jgi:hypothetical protein
MTGPAGRRTRRVPVLVAAATALLAPLGATVARADPTPSPSPSPSLSPSPSPTVELPLTVELLDLSPLAPQPGQTLVVRGRLTNGSSETVSGMQARLLVSPHSVSSRGQFDDYAATPDGNLPPDAVTASTAHASMGRTSLPPGASTNVRLDVPVDDLDLPESWQVYEIGVAVSGSTTLGVTTVGQLRTFLPWAPLGQPGTGAPTPLAWIWPLVDRPHRTTATEWSDDELAGALRPGGRLSVLLDAAAGAQTQHAPPAPRPPRRKHRKPARPAPLRPAVKPVPVTWAIDPMLVQDVQSMKSGYTVGPPGDRHRGSGSAAANTWLTTLQAAVPHGVLLGLPYADTDLVAVIRAGLTPDAQLAAASGQQLLSHAHLTEPLPYAWPVGGFSDQRTLDTLYAGGVTTVVLDSTALPVTGGKQSQTPGAHASVTTRDGRPFDAVLVDHRLSAAVDAAAVDPSLGAFTTQRVLSELLMIQAELPCCARDVVIAPDRRWAPTAALARNLLSGSGRVPWIQPVTVAQVAGAPVDANVERPQVDYPAEARAGELRRGYLRSTLPLKGRLGAFANILPPGDTQPRQFDDGRLRLLSSAWRTDPSGAVEARADLDNALKKTMAKVHILTQANSLITLTGNSGTVPVTLSNDLDTPVTVTVVASADPHLEVRRGARVTRVISPHTKLPVDVRVTALARGVATLKVALYTPPPGSRPYTTAVQLRVRSTAYGLEALLITGGATLVLFVGAGVRLGRRARAARRTARAAS